MALRTFTSVSADGTEIGCEIAGLAIGAGPALLLIHGTADDRFGYDRLAPLIADKYTLYMMDRRGRGLSTHEAPAYAIEREFEDIAALAAAIATQHGAPTNIFAHSYGALCTIGALRNAGKDDGALGRVMLYEPPPGTPSLLVDRMVELNAAGDLEGVMRLQIVDLQRQSPAALERLKSDPKRWPRYLGFAGTISREFVNARRMTLADGEFTDQTRRIHFILGDTSLPALMTHTETALRAFPTADKHVLKGQGHSALRVAPEMVAAEIEDFFN